MHKHTQKKLLIVGAGIAGLALAIMCEQRGVAYDLIERTPRSQPQGYSVTMPPAGLAALRTLGIYDSVRPRASRVDGVLLATSEGRAIDFGKNQLDVITVRRADLHAALLDKIVQPIYYERHFQPDTTSSHQYDLIVGADGLHSQVRAQFLPDVTPRPTGVAFWTGFIPQPLTTHFSTTHITQYWNGGRFAGVFPLPGGASIVLSTHLAPSVDLTHVSLTDHFAGMSDDISKVIATLDQTRLYRGHLHEVKLPRWQQHPYVLIGDAAHAMMPATGMGSTAGMLDAIALIETLTHSQSWQDALMTYEAKRASPARAAQTASRLVTGAMLATGVRGSLNQKAAQLLPDSLFMQIFR